MYETIRIFSAKANETCKCSMAYMRISGCEPDISHKHPSQFYDQVNCVIVGLNCNPLLPQITPVMIHQHARYGESAWTVVSHT